MRRGGHPDTLYSGRGAVTRYRDADDAKAPGSLRVFTAFAPRGRRETRASGPESAGNTTARFGSVHLFVLRGHSTCRERVRWIKGPAVYSARTLLTAVVPRTWVTTQHHRTSETPSPARPGPRQSGTSVSRAEARLGHQASASCFPSPDPFVSDRRVIGHEPWRFSMPVVPRQGAERGRSRCSTRRRRDMGVPGPLRRGYACL